MGLPGKSIPIIVEPLVLPQPAREPDPSPPDPSPAEPAIPVEEPAEV